MMILAVITRVLRRIYAEFCSSRVNLEFTSADSLIPSPRSSVFRKFKFEDIISDETLREIFAKTLTRSGNGINLRFYVDVRQMKKESLQISSQNLKKIALKIGHQYLGLNGGPIKISVSNTPAIVCTQTSTGRKLCFP